MNEKYLEELELERDKILNEIGWSENRLIDLERMSLKVDKELKEIVFQLERLDNNLVTLGEGALRDEHLKRQAALQLRQATLLDRNNVNVEERIAAEKNMLTVWHASLLTWEDFIAEKRSEIEAAKNKKA
jgi:hypothetical protein